MDVQKANTPDLMSDPDVVGTAVGLNEKGRPVILVFTTTGKPSRLRGMPLACPDIVNTRITGHPNITAGKQQADGFTVISNVFTFSIDYYEGP